MYLLSNITQTRIGESKFKKCGTKTWKRIFPMVQKIC